MGQVELGKETISVRYASHSYVIGNNLVGGHLQLGDSNHGPSYTAGEAAWIVVENNTQLGAHGYSFKVLAPVQNAIFRGNRIHLYGANSVGFSVTGDPTYYPSDVSNHPAVPAPNKLYYKGNFVYEENKATGRNAEFLEIQRAPGTGAVFEVDNNTMQIRTDTGTPAWDGFNLVFNGDSSNASIISSHLTNTWATGSKGSDKAHVAYLKTGTTFYNKQTFQ